MSGHPVTAWAMLNALGATTGEVLEALHAGRSGLSPAPADTPFETVCGAVLGELPALPEGLAELDFKNNRMIYAALHEMEGALAAARERWGARRIGIAVGSSTAAMDATEAAFGRWRRSGALPAGFDILRRASPEGMLRAVRARSGAEGPAILISTACSSSGKVFGTARRWLDADLVDAVLVGGADTLCQTTLRGFRALSLVGSEAARPFCAERGGINIGEGAAFALVERSGSGPRLLGVGESADAHHMSSPDPEGRGAALAMQRALEAADRSPGDVDHVNAHGTGTRLNDAMEAAAIRQVLGGDSSAAVVSTKAYTGHTLGAAGATEAIFTLDALSSGRIPASLGADPVDPALPIEVAVEPRRERLRLALSNSFAFGGNNVSVLFGAPE